MSESDVRAGFDRLGAALRAEIQAVIHDAQAIPGIAYMLFDLRAEYAFDEFPIRVQVFGAAGEEVPAAKHLDDRRLLPGRTLLPPEESYPLGHDLCGWDTTPDGLLVERVSIDEFRRAWSEVGLNMEGVQALIGRWDLELEEAPPLIDLATGAQVVVDVLWQT